MTTAIESTGALQLDLMGGTLTHADRGVSKSTAERIRTAAAENTRDAYARQWATYTAWCEVEGRTAEPGTGETLADFANAMVEAGRAMSSIKQAIAAIRKHHAAAGYPDSPPLALATAVLKSAGRDRAKEGTHLPRQSLPVIVDALRKMIETCQSGTLVDVRDHALLTLGIAVFGRRSELAGLNLSDLRSVTEGLVVRIRSSKTDQAGRGVDVPVLHGTYELSDPVRAVGRWREALESRGLDHGRLFRSIDRHGRIGASMSPQSVNLAVQNRARMAALPNVEEYTAHSLRAGAATIAYMNGAPVSEICRLGRWAPGSSVVLGYIRAVDQWKNHPFRGVL